MACFELGHCVGWIPPFRGALVSWVWGIIFSSMRALELVGHLWAFSKEIWSISNGISVDQSTWGPSTVAYSGLRAFESGYGTHVYFLERVRWL